MRAESEERAMEQLHRMLDAEPEFGLVLRKAIEAGEIRGDTLGAIPGCRHGCVVGTLLRWRHGIGSDRFREAARRHVAAALGEREDDYFEHPETGELERYVYAVRAGETPKTSARLAKVSEWLGIWEGRRAKPKARPRPDAKPIEEEKPAGPAQGGLFG